VVTAPADYDPADEVEPVVELGEVAALQTAASRVRVEESLLGYAERVVAETRRSTLFSLGVSPRGFQAWYRAAQAWALTAGREFAVPDDFKEVALPALGHRLVSSSGAESLGSQSREIERALAEILERVPAPV